MGNALFIAWREALEAVLIVSIIYTFLIKQNSFLALRGLRFLWLGISLGLGLSALLAFSILHVQDELVGQTLSYFETGMLFLSALLMTHMVFWMRKYGRTLKKNLENKVQDSLQTSRLWGIALLTSFAVAREGAETVVYFYGFWVGGTLTSTTLIFLAGGAGLLLALITAWLISKGVRYLNYQLFFRITGIFLLVSAAGLISAGTNKLIALEVLPSLLNPLWNSSVFLDSNTSLGSFISSFTGYTSHPSGMLVSVYCMYWMTILFLFKLEKLLVRKTA